MKRWIMDLHVALKPHGFVRRGSAFFRLYGDGVLQVLKFERRRDNLLELQVGLFSMYSELLPQWFTSRDCIPRYSIMNIVGKRDVQCVQLIPNTSGYNQIVLQTVSVDQQLQILRESGIGWLNSIGTQKELFEGIRFLETSWGGSFWWIDSLKVAPCLCCGDLETAKQILAAILEQHEQAYTANRRIFTDEQYKEYLKDRRQEDEVLIKLLRIIENGDMDQIQSYLTQNYAANIILAKFCDTGHA